MDRNIASIADNRLDVCILYCEKVLVFRYQEIGFTVYRTKYEDLVVWIVRRRWRSGRGDVDLNESAKDVPEKSTNAINRMPRIHEFLRIFRQDLAAQETRMMSRNRYKCVPCNDNVIGCGTVNQKQGIEPTRTGRNDLV